MDLKQLWTWRPVLLAVLALVSGGGLGCGSTEPPMPVEPYDSTAKALTVSPELPVSPPPASGTSRFDLAVASGNGIYLVAWADDSLSGNGDVLGMRVRVSDGALLDAQPIQIAAVPSAMEGEPAIAFDGQNFLVVFRAGIGSPQRLFAVRVRASDGAVLGGPQLISKVNMGPGPNYPSQQHASVAFDGVNYLVAWSGAFYENGSYPGAIHAIRVSPSTGETLEQASIIVKRGGTVPPHVAYGNGRYLVTWNNETRISGARINASTGVVLDALAPIRFSEPVPSYVRAQAASSGDQFLVVWNTEGGQIMGNRVRGSDGVLLDGTGFTVEQSTIGAPTITFDGRDYRVSWPGRVAGAPTVMSTRVSPQGVSAPTSPLTPVIPYFGLSISYPIAAAEPGRFGVVYNSFDSATHNRGQIFMRLVEDVQEEEEPCEPGAPTLLINGDAPLTLECQPGATYSDPGAQAHDGCGNPVEVHAYNTGADSSGPGPLLQYEGVYSVSYAAWNSAGSANATRTVRVADRTAPSLTRNGPAHVVHTCATGNWTDPGVTVADACYGNIWYSVVRSGEVNAWAEGTYTVTYSLTDPAGNSAVPVTRTVEVVDCPW